MHHHVWQYALPSDSPILCSPVVILMLFGVVVCLRAGQFLEFPSLQTVNQCFLKGSAVQALEDEEPAPQLGAGRT